jgi:H+-transporting ATPase
VDAPAAKVKDAHRGADGETGAGAGEHVGVEVITGQDSLDGDAGADYQGHRPRLPGEPIASVQRDRRGGKRRESERRVSRVEGPVGSAIVHQGRVGVDPRDRTLHSVLGDRDQPAVHAQALGEHNHVVQPWPEAAERDPVGDGRHCNGQRDRHSADDVGRVAGVADDAAIEGATETDLLLAGALASQEANQDPIDLAFLAAAKERHVFDGLPRIEPISFAPFDAKRRRTEAVVEQNGQRFRVMKGALRTIAEVCGLTPAAIEDLEARVRASAEKGYRTLAVARGPETVPLALVGLVSLYDPPRPDAKELIATLRDRGVGVKMLTGDALPVASEIARGVGLSNIRRMADLKAASAHAGTKTSDLFAGADGFAEVFPEDKYVVVKQLQGAGHITGMTGDGVNDAPALRQAEVGIAVSTATDVAKGAASVVLTEPGLTNIVALVEQGRTIYQRILTWIVNKISRTILKAAFVAVAFVLTGKFVVSVFAMLLLTFMTDFAKIALATDHVRPSKNPETWNIGGFVTVSVVLGLAMVAETLLLLWFGWSRFGLATNDSALYTFSFLMLLYFAVFSVVSARERHAFWSTLPSKTLLAALVADAFTGTVLTRVGLPGLMPLPLEQTLAIFVYAIVSCLVVNDALKVVMIKWRVPNAAVKKLPT